MKIGVISDTHGYFPDSVFSYFKEVDEIWHIGDVGDKSIIDDLETIAPVFGVYGNIDGTEVRVRLPEYLILNREGLNVFMAHILGKPPKYKANFLGIIRENNPDLILAGHSHIPMVTQDKVNGCLFINPGAAGNHGFHKIRTIIRFSIEGKKIENMELIELGKRGT